MRVDLLRRELADLSVTPESRNQTIGQLQAQLAASQQELAITSHRINDYASRLSAADEQRAAERQRFLGHASVTTTAGYAMSDLSELRSLVEVAFDRATPR